MRIDLKNLQSGVAGATPRTTIPRKCRSRSRRRIRLARCRDHHLAPLRIDPLHNRDFLRATGEKAAVAHFLNLHHGRIVMNQKRDRIKIADV